MAHSSRIENPIGSVVGKEPKIEGDVACGDPVRTNEAETPGSDCRVTVLRARDVICRLIDGQIVDGWRQRAGGWDSDGHGLRGAWGEGDHAALLRVAERPRW